MNITCKGEESWVDIPQIESVSSLLSCRSLKELTVHNEADISYFLITGERNVIFHRKGMNNFEGIWEKGAKENIWS
jgi:hypothetical protein